MFTSSGKRVKQGPKAAAQRKLGLAARISYAIGGIIALLWLVFFVLPYSKNLDDVGLPDSVTNFTEKANSLEPNPKVIE